MLRGNGRTGEHGWCGMTWYAWAMVAALGVAMAVKILTVGDTPKPTTPSVALVSLVLNGLLVWGIVELATRHA